MLKYEQSYRVGTMIEWRLFYAIIRAFLPESRLHARPATKHGPSQKFSASGMRQFSQQHRLAHDRIAKWAFVQFRNFIYINLLPDKRWRSSAIPKMFNRRKPSSPTSSKSMSDEASTSPRAYEPKRLAEAMPYLESNGKIIFLSSSVVYTFDMMGSFCAVRILPS